MIFGKRLETTKTAPGGLGPNPGRFALRERLADRPGSNSLRGGYVDDLAGLGAVCGVGTGRVVVRPRGPADRQDLLPALGHDLHRRTGPGGACCPAVLAEEH